MPRTTAHPMQQPTQQPSSTSTAADRTRDTYSVPDKPVPTPRNTQ